MITIAIGDIHGRDTWLHILGPEKWDKVVIVGDYFDSFDIPYHKQMENFRTLIAYKKAHMDDIILLLGNHDYHYLMQGKFSSERYSGFQPEHALKIQKALKESRHLMQVAYQQGDVLFTHAGVTKSWLAKHKESPEKVDDIADWLNEHWKIRPFIYGYNYNDDTSGYGECISQGPMWVRPQSLLEDRITGYIQVVGHTRVSRIREPLYKDSLVFIDTLEGIPQYLVINDGLFVIRDA